MSATPGAPVEATSRPALPLVEPSSPAAEEPGLDPSLPPSSRLSPPPPALEDLARSKTAGRPIQQELSERVENFRRRRARLRGDTGPDANLEFDFQGESGGEADPALDARVIDFPRDERGFDVVLETPGQPGDASPEVDSLSLERPESFGDLDPQPLADGDYGLDSEPPLARPVEVVLDSQPLIEEDEEPVLPPRLTLAPLGRRFLGGLVDALVLGIAAGMFALIFWRAGGHVTPQPLNYVVGAFIAVIFILAYFGTFTAITSTTPGLLWVGIEVRSQNGAHPTPQQAFWRAFGVLVSISALMLGFVWALVDSENLTWHDRMSDTFLTLADYETESRELGA
jgi:uncharacterized RDD family membrane protein YckC